MPFVRFRHADALWQEFPALVPGVVYVAGVGPAADVAEPVGRYTALARTRLAGGTESELPEIRAWRRTFGRLGLKPTQYRCASESLLRRLRKEGELPSIHPVIDLCNAISLAFAVPVAVFDVAEVAGDLEVRRATGEESYLTFGGQTEHPEPGEVIFADEDGLAHARRWTNRQSGRSAVRETTTRVLVVAEGLHESAPDDVARLVASVTEELTAGWRIEPRTAVLTRAAPELAV
ncbi:MAG: B3/B4 domain-containing protein [Actinophytocola sp.]|uniref:B3/B4 domain-containing protein n=1 Tax=Actinophytocola sp. TaxID=1872138 RepID=UPI003D6AFB59